MENFQVVIAAVITLVGTLTVAIFGYRQWKRQHNLTRSGTVLAEKQAAYKTIWQKLEAVHLFVRSEKFDRTRYYELVREVNVEMMQSGLFLEKGEARLVNEYLESMEVFAKSLDEQEDFRIRENVRETMYTTAELPTDIFEQAQSFREAYNDLEAKREMVIGRFRRAIGADNL